MPHTLAQNAHFIKGLDPIVDFADGGCSSDIINMAEYSHIAFLVYWGVATGGTAKPTITAVACSTVGGVATTAIRFKSKDCTSDTELALTWRDTTGYQVASAGSSQLHLVEIDAADVLATGYQYVRVTLAETVNDPCVGGIIAIGYKPRYAQDIPVAATV